MINISRIFPITIGIVATNLLTPVIAQAAVFNMSSFPLLNGYNLSGTITTDDTLGILSKDNIIDYNIALEGGQNPFTFTPVNSDIRIFGVRVNSDNSEIFVSRNSNFVIDATPESIINKTFIFYDFRKFSFASTQRRNFNYIFNGFSQTFISPIPGTDNGSFTIATVQEITTTPEPNAIISLFGLGLGFIAVRSRKQN